jgi:hypothetical protein
VATVGSARRCGGIRAQELLDAGEHGVQHGRLRLVRDAKMIS